MNFWIYDIIIYSGTKETFLVTILIILKRRYSRNSGNVLGNTTVSIQNWLVNGRSMTISSRFFANSINIFQKTEVQTVILKCLTGLNPNWYKSYDHKSLANSPKLETNKWPFYDHFWPFFCQLYEHLSQNWGSDGHFEVLNRSKS